MALVMSLCACASPDVPRLPDDLREDGGTGPDLRHPTIIDSVDTISPEEAEAAIRRLEEARDRHIDATRRAIERR